MHYFPAYKFLTLAVTALSLNSISSVDAAPQNQNTNSLTSKVQAYLRSQGVNATIPASAQSYGGGSNTTGLTCGILKAYRNSDLVTPLDGPEYVNEAEQHWCVDIFHPSTGIIQYPRTDSAYLKVTHCLAASQLYLRANHNPRSPIRRGAFGYHWYNVCHKERWPFTVRWFC